MNHEVFLKEFQSYFRNIAVASTPPNDAFLDFHASVSIDRVLTCLFVYKKLKHWLLLLNGSLSDRAIILHMSLGEYNTILSAYTLYRHLG